ncbi:hypothetical protein AB0D45_09675 [Streptomyces sp. NPDC048352]|uniref:hypothetical protein n=1 Tax=Streptomyces sp. NPDC048352 TaxID=3154718 RepID=UPI003442037C
MPRTGYRPDFRPDGFEPVNDRAYEAFWDHIDSDRDSMTTLAAHHSPDDRHSYYVIHNGAVTWGVPGEPQLVALCLERDIPAKVYSFEHATLPLPAMAQSWLIKRGCPAEAIASTRPAPQLLENLLRVEQERISQGWSAAMGRPGSSPTRYRPRLKT